MEKRIPLGFIELESGKKPIYAFYDFFLNFTFDKEENWEDLRLIVNILLDAYIQRNPETIARLIEDEILVTTQYEQYLNNLATPKKQDFMLEEINLKKFTFLEMQNSAYTTPPVEVRATDYSVLSISQNPGRVSNQIWILAEDVKKLLPGGAFSNYVPKDEVSGAVYPQASGIMFISLKRLSEEKTVAGELASFLLGKTGDAKSEEVKRLADTFRKSCEKFCNDKGVKISMSVKEKLQMEARWEGNIEGIQELAGLIKSGLSVDEAMIKLAAKHKNLIKGSGDNSGPA